MLLARIVMGNLKTYSISKTFDFIFISINSLNIHVIQFIPIEFSKAFIQSFSNVFHLWNRMISIGVKISNGIQIRQFKSYQFHLFLCW